MALDAHAGSNGMVCEKGGDGGVNRPLVIVAPLMCRLKKVPRFRRACSSCGYHDSPMTIFIFVTMKQAEFINRAKVVAPVIVDGDTAGYI